MIFRTYKTNRWLWWFTSLAIFVAIGFAVQFPVKGLSVSLARRCLDIVFALFSGQEEFPAVLFLAVVLTVWIVVAVTVGWFLQSVIVIAISRRQEKSK